MIDISRSIKIEPLFCKNKDQPELNKDYIALNVHASTHIDFPSLMISKGKSSLDYESNYFVGSCYVKDCTYLNHRILKRDLQAINFETYDFILFKTKNSKDKFLNPDFIYLAEEAALYLSAYKLKGVGIDGLSIEREQEGHPSHKILLGQEILIYEGLDLSGAEEGVYEFIGLPLKIEDGASVPVGAIIR